jgi:DNA replication protein DnaC
MLEIIQDRHGIRSTIVTSQLPVKKWHDAVGDPTIADAIMDRLVHGGHRIDLKGQTMRSPLSDPSKTTA